MSLIESGGHWYSTSGEACHTVPKVRGGGTKPTTIKEARAMHLLPSVTSVIKDTMAQPRNLVQWSYRKVAMAGLTWDKKATDLLDDDYLDVVIDAAFQETRDAADEGTGIHEALQHYFSSEPHDPKFDVFVNAVANWVQQEGVHVIQRELRLVNARDGYAGTTDAIVQSSRGLGVLDFKRRKSKPQYPMNPWEDNATQIAAYYMAHFGQIDDSASGANLLISATEPGRVQGAWYDANKLREEWEKFTHILAIWRIAKGYDPRS